MKGIIFDIDGTLWDSTKEVAISWNEVLEKEMPDYPPLTREILIGEFGKPMPEIMKSLFPMLSQEEQDALGAKMYKQENERVEWAPCVVYDGVASTIAELSKRFPLFIVSNCQDGYIEATMKNIGIEKYITDFTCPSYTGKLKGDNIRIIMERNNLDEAIYIGDTMGDYKACQEAGVDFILASYGFGDVPDVKSIDRFDELLDIL